MVDPQVTPGPGDGREPPGQSAVVRRSTPRPTFVGPSVIRREATAHHVWGDAGSGLVTDRVYSSTENLHVLEFELAPGGGFRHSPSNQTVFAADVAYAVLTGELVIANPRLGEVQIVAAGELVLFHRDTWHHGFNPAGEPVRVLEFFAPPPSRRTASDYARTQPALESSTYRDARWDRDWPAAAEQCADAATLHVVGADRTLWSLRDDAPSHLVGVQVDTPFLRVVRGRVYPGHVEDPLPVPDESVVVVTDGELWVDAQETEGNRLATARLCEGDAMFVPAGAALRVLNRSAEQAAYLMGSGYAVDADWHP